MHKNTKIAIAAGTAALLAVAGTAGLAIAHKGKDGHGSWRGHHGMIGLQMMERYDADKDGKITQAEIDQNRTAWHVEFDADKNATLSLEEFKLLWLKARFEEMVREFQEFDRDGNGQVTLDEYKYPMAQMVARRDRNGDGALSREDREMRHKGHGADDGMKPEEEDSQ